MANLSYAEVSLVLKADFETGTLFWLPRTPDMFRLSANRTSEANCAAWNGRYAGKEALAHASTDGYLCGHLLGPMCKAHRAIWLLYYREWPSDQIDHINGDRGDNRISNLRVVTNAENGKNQRKSKKNTSGVQGVSWDKRYGKWIANITVSGRRKYLGSFSEFDAAVQKRSHAEALYGFHPNHGR